MSFDLNLNETIEDKFKEYLAEINIANSSNDEDKAYELGIKAFRLGSDDYSLLNALGMQFVHMQKYDEALICFKKVNEINPQYLTGLINLALAYEKTSSYVEAEKYYIKALNIEPTYKLYLKVAQMIFANENVSYYRIYQAIDCLNNAKKIDSTSVGLYNLYIRAWSLLGNYANANKNAKISLKLKPTALCY